MKPCPGRVDVENGALSVRILATEPRLDVDKAQMHISSMKKTFLKIWNLASIYSSRMFFRLMPLLPLHHFFTCLSLFDFLPSLAGSCTHAQESNANSLAIVVHVFITSWQLRGSRNGITLSWRWTQTGSNCAVTQARGAA